MSSTNVKADGNEKITADAENNEGDQILETEQEKRTRIVSLNIIYFTMFLMTLGFSIILTGIWPYLDKVNFENIIRKCIKFKNVALGQGHMCFFRSSNFCIVISFF